MLYIRCFKRFLTACLLLLASAGAAQSATYNVVGGELIGAFGVDVDGSLYDVVFGDGSCISLYSGCDAESDFPFAGGPASQTAAEALITQVFGNGDVYDADPTKTRGCETTTCFLMMPYLFSTNASFPGYVNIKGGRNTNLLNEGAIVGFSIAAPIQDLKDISSWTYTQWTPAVSAVPLPAAVWLFATALIGLFGFGKRRRGA